MQQLRAIRNLGNLQYGSDHNAHFFVIADSTLKE